MYEIDQQPNDVQIFDVNSFYPGIRDAKVFEIPSYCGTKINKCSVFSTCGAVRSSI
jgi:hypothetical protein